MGAGIGWVGGDRGLEAPPGLVAAAQRIQRRSQICPGLHQRRVDGQCLLVQAHGFFGTVGATADVAQVDPGCCKFGVAIEGAAVVVLGLGHPPLGEHQVSQHRQGIGVVGAEFQDAVVQAGGVAKPALGREQRAEVEHGAGVARVLFQRLRIEERRFSAAPGLIVAQRRGESVGYVCHGLGDRHLSLTSGYRLVPAP